MGCGGWVVLWVGWVGLCLLVVVVFFGKVVLVVGFGVGEDRLWLVWLWCVLIVWVVLVCLLVCGVLISGCGLYCKGGVVLIFGLWLKFWGCVWV